MSNTVLLNSLMKSAFNNAFEDDDITEISVNKPGDFFVAKRGQRNMVKIKNSELTYNKLKDFAIFVADASNQEISHEKPLLSAQISSIKYKDLFYRVQIVMDPAVYTGKIGMSIRKPSILSLDYENYKTMLSEVKIEKEKSPAEEELLELYKNEQFWEFLKKAVQYRKNILISAGTDSGKTTLFNSLIKLIDIDERIITIEDAKELDPPHPNVLQLYYSRGDQGVAKVTAQDLMEACLRLRPQRLFLGEIRGAEAFTFLGLISSGQEGSIATIHANNPITAIDTMALKVAQAKTTLTPEEVKNYVKSNIDVIVQLKRKYNGDYGCSNIYYQLYEDEK